jgi:ankyrin repeat protein
VRLLLQAGVSANTDGARYGTVVEAGAWSRSYDSTNSLAITELFVAHGVDVNAVSDGTYGTALQAFVHAGHTGTVKFLLEQGALINTVGGRYGTALHAAVIRYRVETVDLLLRKEMIRDIKRSRFFY